MSGCGGLPNEVGTLGCREFVHRPQNDLPGKVADEAERIFLKEAISCYHYSLLFRKFIYVSSIQAL